MRWRFVSNSFKWSSAIRSRAFQSATPNCVRYLTPRAVAIDSSFFPAYQSAIAALIATTTATGLISGGYLLCDSCDAIEAETGVSYPRYLDGGNRLVGTSARLMGGIVQVYSVGVYVVPDSIRNSLGRSYSAVKPGELVADCKFWDNVCENDLLLRLVVVRQVNGTHMASGFERGLSRVMSIKRPTPAMKKFGGLFKKLGNMKVGSEMIINCNPASGIVDLVVDGREIGSVQDFTLAKALPLMYLGDKSVTPSLRENAAEGFSQCLL